MAVVGRKADGGEHRRPDGSSKKREDKMKWSEQTIPERVTTMQRHYERMAKELYPDGVPMEAYKTEPKKHELYQDYMTFANQLNTILENK